MAHSFLITLFFEIMWHPGCVEPDESLPGPRRPGAVIAMAGDTTPAGIFPAGLAQPDRRPARRGRIRGSGARPSPQHGSPAAEDWARVPYSINPPDRPVSS